MRRRKSPRDWTEEDWKGFLERQARTKQRLAERRLNGLPKRSPEEVEAIKAKGRKVIEANHLTPKQLQRLSQQFAEADNNEG
jgi:hypothetical protein